MEQVAEDTGYHNDEFGAAFVDGDYEALRKLYDAATTERDRAIEKLADLASAPSIRAYHDLIDEAAESIVKSLEPTAHASWICYFLEAVESEVLNRGTDYDFKGTLLAVKGDIETRLGTGGW